MEKANPSRIGRRALGFETCCPNTPPDLKREHHPARAVEPPGPYPQWDRDRGLKAVSLIEPNPRRTVGLLWLRGAHRDPEPRVSVLDCGPAAGHGPLPLSDAPSPSKSARGLAQSKTWRPQGRFLETTS